MGVADQYTNELKQQFGYRATWLPNVARAVVDVGRMNSDGSFQQLSSLGARAIGYNETPGPGASDYSYASKSGVSILFKSTGQTPSAGSVLVQADAGCMINFSRDSGVVFAAKTCTVSSIIDRVLSDKRCWRSTPAATGQTMRCWLQMSSSLRRHRSSLPKRPVPRSNSRH